MELIKGFFRKKQTYIYLILFSVLFSVMSLLNGFRNYYLKLNDDFMHEHSTVFIFSKEAQDFLLKSEKLINSYIRVLGFEKGMDNDIIGDDVDFQKLNWEDLVRVKERIMTFPDSYCNENINKNEVILVTSEFRYKEEIINNLINKEINFTFYGEDVVLNVKKVLEAKSNSYICISSELYDRLLDKEEMYIYSINTRSYDAMGKLNVKWEELEDDGTLKIYFSTFINDFSSLPHNIEELITMLSTVNTISMIIFVVITIFVIKDLVSDEEKDILLLKEIGFNKWQNMGNSLRNMIVLDVIVFGLSILVSGLIVFLLNIVCGFNLELFNVECAVYLSLFVLLVELVFHAMFIRKY